MLKKNKIPFVIAPLLFMANWGFFFYYNTGDVYLVLIWLTLVIAQAALIQKNYPVISENGSTAFFVLFSTLIPISDNFTFAAMALSAVYFPFFYLSSKSYTSLKLSAYAGTFTGVIFLLSSRVSVLFAVTVLGFLTILSQQRLRGRLVAVFLLAAVQVPFTYFLLRYVTGWQIGQIDTGAIHTPKMEILVWSTSFLIMLFSTGNYFKFKINRRKHISVVNVITLSLLVFYSVTKNGTALLILPMMWFMLAFFQEKGSLYSFLMQIVAVIYAVTVPFVLYGII